MKIYELTVVLGGKATPAKAKSTQEKIEKMTKAAGGKVAGFVDMGTLELAHKIKKHETGKFLQFKLELESKSAANFKDKLRLEDDFIRYLLVRN